MGKQNVAQTAESLQSSKLPVKDARTMLDLAVEEIEDYGVVDPTKSNPYPLFYWNIMADNGDEYKLVSRGIFALVLVVIGAGCIEFAMEGISWTGFALFGLFGATVLHTCLNLKLYNGITDNIFKRAITKLFFRKESKEILEAHRQKFEEYKKLEEPLKLFIDITRNQLEKDKVFETLHKNGEYVFLLDNGKIFSLSEEEYRSRNPEIMAREFSDRHDKLMKKIETKMMNMI